MKVSALFRKGETLDRSDRAAIALLKKLGFPSDYLEFLLQYGEGEFIDSFLSLEAPASLAKGLVKSDMTFTFNESILIGGLDGGDIMAVDHVGKVHLEYWPRVETEPRPVFVTLDSMVNTLAANPKKEGELLLYSQRGVPMCTFGNLEPAEGPPKVADAVVKDLLKLHPVNNFQIIFSEEVLRLHNEKLGTSISFNGGRKVDLKFRYEAKLKEIGRAHV